MSLEELEYVAVDVDDGESLSVLDDDDAELLPHMFSTASLTAPAYEWSAAATSSSGDPHAGGASSRGKAE